MTMMNPIVVFVFLTATFTHNSIQGISTENDDDFNTPTWSSGGDEGNENARFFHSFL